LTLGMVPDTVTGVTGVVVVVVGAGATVVVFGA
jgi:hypothetical protein